MTAIKKIYGRWGNYILPDMRKQFEKDCLEAEKEETRLINLNDKIHYSHHKKTCAIMSTRDGWDADCTCGYTAKEQQIKELKDFVRNSDHLLNCDLAQRIGECNCGLVKLNKH